MAFGLFMGLCGHCRQSSKDNSLFILLFRNNVGSGSRLCGVPL